MLWRFQSPYGSLAVELEVLPHGLVLWPDSLLPHNTFSMCIGACTVRGLVRTGGQEVRVAGGGFYDHPRVLAEANDVPPFGWYLYAPVRFSNGTMIVRFGGDTGQSIHEARSRLMLPRSTVLRYFAISEL